ncbi:14942_t:CDS:2 [Entrophospora sp. SA101]|nr:14942_t:CDS:2 [Entrophospora sp. SA101]
MASTSSFRGQQQVSSSYGGGPPPLPPSRNQRLYGKPLPHQLPQSSYERRPSSLSHSSSTSSLYSPNGNYHHHHNYYQQQSHHDHHHNNNYLYNHRSLSSSSSSSSSSTYHGSSSYPPQQQQLQSTLQHGSTSSTSNSLNVNQSPQKTLFEQHTKPIQIPVYAPTYEETWADCKIEGQRLREAEAKLTESVRKSQIDLDKVNWELEKVIHQTALATRQIELLFANSQEEIEALNKLAEKETEENQLALINNKKSELKLEELPRNSHRMARDKRGDVVETFTSISAEPA